jgi:hypothetical protein
MCCLAPSALIDKNIRWETIDPLSVKADYTNGKITISATLFFNENGKLVNFISNDRFETDGKVYKSYPWSTPIINYKETYGYNLPSQLSTESQRQDLTFTYGEWKLKQVEYNCKELR